LLELNQAVQGLAAQFLTRSNLPPKAKVDAIHSAAATVHFIGVRSNFGGGNNNVPGSDYCYNNDFNAIQTGIRNNTLAVDNAIVATASGLLGLSRNSSVSYVIRRAGGDQTIAKHLSPLAVQTLDILWHWPLYRCPLECLLQR
jgi:hypothetical protein